MWGATRQCKLIYILSKDFNPRTHVGCDMVLMLYCLVVSQFQSTHPCGVRHYIDELDQKLTKISIHAPMWGATMNTSLRAITEDYFNPRTHVGCDMSIFKETTGRELFQSTHPCGVRLANMEKHKDFDIFQSTHPCGVRHLLSFTYLTIGLFQSTHPCGVRQN